MRLVIVLILNEYNMKKIAYIVFLLFCACYISSCSEDRYFPGEIYQDVDIMEMAMTVIGGESK